MELALKIGTIIDGSIGFENGKPIIGKKLKVETVITKREGSKTGLEVDEKTLEVKNNLEEYKDKAFEFFCITEQRVIATGIIGKDPVRKSFVNSEPVDGNAG